MLYLYETHLHTRPTSICATSTPEEMVRTYAAYGYSGIFVSDHFVDASRHPELGENWEAKMRLQYQGYQDALAAGQEFGMDVFFAWEYCSYPKSEDYLVYGLGLDFLLAHPDFDKLPFPEVSRLIHKHDGYIIRAHPYRQEWYIPEGPSVDVTLIDGIEINNKLSFSRANHNMEAWRLAEQNPSLVRTSGSDVHDIAKAGYAGMAFPYPIHSSQDYIDALKRGDGWPIIDGIVCDRNGHAVAM